MPSFPRVRRGAKSFFGAKLGKSVSKRDNFPFWNWGTGGGLEPRTETATRIGGYYTLYGEKSLRVSATTRNWNTISAICDILEVGVAQTCSLGLRQFSFLENRRPTARVCPTRD